MVEKASVARPYAQAIFELANELGQMIEWSDVLEAAAKAVVDKQVAAIIDSPSADNNQLCLLIGDVAIQASIGADKEKLINLLKLLAENGRLSLLPEISRAYELLKSEIENRVSVTLFAASPVGDDQKEKIVDALQIRLGRDVSLKFELDKNLIGGARLQADDLIIDGSVSAGLEKLATSLAN
ncbi:MAG: F0F1 ATP synthase subunit delta [Pseudomonadota bacterium]|nr:F0F1 ATP synthase subunit delta [Pseudomonadota bacterium]